MNTNAIRKLSLRGAERRSNPNKNEIAAPFELAMTCNDIYCVRIRFEFWYVILIFELWIFQGNASYELNHRGIEPFSIK